MKTQVKGWSSIAYNGFIERLPGHTDNGTLASNVAPMLNEGLLIALFPSPGAPVRSQLSTFLDSS